MAPPPQPAQPIAGAAPGGRRHDPPTRPGRDPPPRRPSRRVGPKTASLERPGHPRSPDPSYADTRSGRRPHRFGDGRDASVGTDVVGRARQVQCDRVSFSCKGRGACPSCNAKRMAETAAHLVGHVIPHVPVRRRGRDPGCPGPPAQNPACGTTAPGSHLGSWHRSGCSARDAEHGLGVASGPQGVPRVASRCGLFDCDA